MGKSTTPKGKTKVTFNIDDRLLEKMKIKANEEGWSNTLVINEALKMYLGGTKIEK